MPKIVLVAVFFMTFLLCVSGQKVAFDYARTYTFEGEDQVEDMAILSDGILVAVGSHRLSGSPSKGLLLVINPDDGTLIKRNVYEADSGQSAGFSSVAESGDGTLYLVGHVNEKKKDRNPWLIRLDQNYKVLKEHNLDMPEDNVFKKIVWLETGYGLIAGWKNAKEKGQIWIKNIDGNSFQEIDTLLGHGAFGAIIGMDLSINNRVWLSGNTQKSKHSKRGDAWVVQIDAAGNVTQELTLGENFYDQLHSSSSSVTGELLLGGEKWSRSSDFGNSWVIELDAQGSEVYNNVFEADGTQIAAGVLKKPRNDRWVSLQASDWAAIEDRIKFLLAADDIEAQYPIEVGNDNRFEVKKILLSYYDQYLVAGNLNLGKKSGQSFKLVSFNEESILIKQSPTITVTDPKLEDENGDEILSPGELGTIYFFIENTSGNDIPKMVVKTALEQNATGVAITKPNRFIPFLPKGMRKRINIPVKGLEQDASRPNGKLEIVISTNQEKVHSFSAQLENIIKADEAILSTSLKSFNSEGVKITWQQPNLISTGSREISTPNNTYTIKLNVSSRQAIRANDPKIYRNNRLLVDGKNSFPRLSEPIEEGNWLDYSLSFDIQDLEEGKNEIQVKIGGVETNVTINYVPRKPDLHLLAVGPHYADLKYTAKDAIDFASIIAQQRNRGFFNRVFIDTLVDAASTNKTNIVTAFEIMRNRYRQKSHPRNIKPNDYLIVFLSGHGIKYEGSFRLLPTDYNPDAKATTTINYKEDLLTFLDEIQCKKFMFIDACLSGAAKGNKSINPSALNKALQEANESVSGMVAFSSSSQNQLSYEDEAWENGAFTEALLEALNAREVQLKDGRTILADQNSDSNSSDGILTIKELYDFLKVRVPDLVLTQKRDAEQVPTLINHSLKADIPLFIIQ